jgi:hypothetical protein
MEATLFKGRLMYTMNQAAESVFGAGADYLRMDRMVSGAISSIHLK